MEDGQKRQSPATVGDCLLSVMGIERLAVGRPWWAVGEE
jgi:hypothetical protein